MSDGPFDEDAPSPGVPDLDVELDDWTNTYVVRDKGHGWYAVFGVNHMGAEVAIAVEKDATIETFKHAVFDAPSPGVVPEAEDDEDDEDAGEGS